MRLFRSVLFSWLRLCHLFERATGRGAFGRPEVQVLQNAFPETANRLKSALWKHYMRQFNAASCSVATVATVINALLESGGRLTHPVTQAELLNTVRTANWKQRMSPAGDHGRRGLPLPLLARIVESSLKAYGIAYRSLEVLQAVKPPRRAGRVQQALAEHLAAFERRGDRVVIAHFDQGELLRTLHIPHISPVGAFDARAGQVSVLDVDPEAPGPYRVSLDVFYRSLSADYNPLFRKFGYGSGGCVIIRTAATKPQNPKSFPTGDSHDPADR